MVGVGVAKTIPLRMGNISCVTKFGGLVGGGVVRVVVRVVVRDAFGGEVKAIVSSIIKRMYL
jgi:hypothetical protein